jgi:hypothetical protein
MPGDCDKDRELVRRGLVKEAEVEPMNEYLEVHDAAYDGAVAPTSSETRSI